MGRGISGLIVPTSDGIGEVIAFAGTTAPIGTVECDGASYLTTEKSDLFNVIGYIWGGSGANFNVPDLRGAFLRGTGSHGTENMANGNDFAGPSVGSFENDQMQGHRHGNDVFQEAAGTATIRGATGSVAQGSVDTKNPVTDGTNGTPRTGDETRPFNAGVKFCIRYAPKAGVLALNILPSLPLAANTTLINSQIQSYSRFNVTTGSSSNVTITLPAGSSDIKDIPIKISKVDSGTKFVEIASASNIRGSSSSIYAIAQNESIELVWNGSEYQLTSDPNRYIKCNVAFAGTPSILDGDSNWVSSIDDNAVGQIDLNIVSGVFLSTPHATCTPWLSTVSSNCVIDGISTSVIVLYYYNQSNNLVDGYIGLHVIGLK